MQTFIHIFEKCNQDWFAVASILECLVQQLVQFSPHLKEIFLRGDNAGCYHNASLLISAPTIAARGGLTLRNYSFSEASSGKDVCDRKIAPLKAHIARYLNEGNVISCCNHTVLGENEFPAALRSSSQFTTSNIVQPTKSGTTLKY